MTDTKNKIKKIVIKREACIGAATCVVLAPGVFDLDEQGIAILKDNYSETDADTIIKAAQSCPTQAIEVYDEDDNKLV